MRALLAALLLALCLHADDRLRSAQPNAPSERNKPYVLLIGVDGYRPDFVDKYDGKALKAFGERGSHATALIPSFPSTTFPNFYTMVTGMRPQSHGMVSMQFFDPQTREAFSYTRNAAEGKWFSGAMPLWNIAEQQGMRTRVHQHREPLPHVDHCCAEGASNRQRGAWQADRQQQQHTQRARRHATAARDRTI